MNGTGLNAARSSTLNPDRRAFARRHEGHRPVQRMPLARDPVRTEEVRRCIRISTKRSAANVAVSSTASPIEHGLPLQLQLREKVGGTPRLAVASRLGSLGFDRSSSWRERPGLDDLRPIQCDGCRSLRPTPVGCGDRRAPAIRATTIVRAKGTSFADLVGAVVRVRVEAARCEAQSPLAVGARTLRPSRGAEASSIEQMCADASLCVVKGADFGADGDRPSAGRLQSARSRAAGSRRWFLHCRPASHLSVSSTPVPASSPRAR